jgi:membrane protein
MAILRRHEIGPARLAGAARHAGGALVRYAADVGRFVAYLGRRFSADRCVQVAASLTFTSWLSIVPAVAVGFALAAVFPVFTGVKGELESFLADNFLPSSAAVVQQYLEQFTSAARRLTAIGVISLFITAVLLLGNIETAFNQIWRVRQRRAMAFRLASYWAVLTLGPLLFGLSVSLSGYLFATARASGVESYTGSLARAVGLMPPLLTFIGFTLVYVTLPNQPVRLRHAAIGAVVATLMFELLKRGFGVYLAHVPTYQAIYGALSVLPILLLWSYMTWCVVLFGAVSAASLPRWRQRGRGAVTGGAAPARKLAVALGLLSALRAASRDGLSIKREKLLAAVGVMPDEDESVLETLADHRYIARVGRDRWLLSRDLEAVSLSQLAALFGLNPVRGDAKAGGEAAWNAALADIFGALEVAGRDALGPSVESFLKQGEPRDAPPSTVRRFHA